MKIALVIERMDPARGGRETSAAQIAAALADRGADVTILCQSGSWRHGRVEVCSLGRRGLTRRGILKNFAHDVRAETRRRKFDIVHGTLPAPGVNVYQPRSGTAPAQRRANLRRRTPVGRLWRRLTGGLNRCRALMGRMERRLLADPSVWCLPNSNMVARELERYYRRTERVRVVFNAVDLPKMSGQQRADHRRRLRDEMGARARTVVFLTIARNFALKGVGESIVAFAKWHHGRADLPDARLVLLGGQSVGGYRQMASRREVDRHVLFVGPTEEAAPWYAAADACVLLSWYDPCSRAVLEATRMGIPSITTAFNGAAEALADGAGVVVPSPAGGDDVVEAFETMYDDARRADAAEACRIIADSLAIDRHVDELMRTYAEVTGQ